MFSPPLPPCAQATFAGMARADAPHFETQVPPSGAAGEYGLFFALMPPIDVAHRAWRLAHRMRELHGLPQPAMPPLRLHVTVQPVVRLPRTVPALIVRAARAAAERIDGCSAPRLAFHSAGSLSPFEPTALALLCDGAGAAAIVALRAQLRRSLRHQGFMLPCDSPLPHMTLVYGARHVPVAPIEPLAWAATGLRLVLSHRGRGHHEVLGEWPLRLNA